MTTLEPPEWSVEPLWQKARLYVQRALAEDRNGPLFPLWLTLALEFIGRAALARVHPVLLADPRDGDNILYAFGYSTKERGPRSVPAKTVFTRCAVVVADFTGEDADDCLALVERRNAELHSGMPAFENYPSRLWLANYFRMTELLLGGSGKTLEDLFGTAEADAAHRMVEGMLSEVLADVRRRIQACKKVFDALPSEDQEVRQRGAEKEPAGHLQAAVQCPACGSLALFTGEQVGAEEPRLEDDELVVTRTVLPTACRCGACGLALDGYKELHAAELGGQYTTEDRYDPAEYYRPEIEDAYGYDYDEYMNE